MKAKNAKKVLIISTTNLGYNGITSMILNYYKNIDKSKLTIDFLSGMNIMSWVQDEIKRHKGKIYIVSNRKKNTLRYMKDLYYFFKKYNYDSIHIHGNSSTMLIELFPAMKAGVKTKITHSHNSSCKNKLAHKILNDKFRSYSDVNLACSKFAGEWLYKDNFEVIENGIDVEKYRFKRDIRNQLRNKLNITNEFVIGHIGNFSYQKNTEFITSLAKETLKNKDLNLKFMLIGDGIGRIDIQKNLKELNLESKFIFVGKIGNINDYLQAMDVFILPSRFEGLPISMLEAQACGLPCIVSEKITREAKILDEVYYLGIEEIDLKKWGQKLVEIKDFNIDRENGYLKLNKSKFDIKTQVKKLEDIYLNN